MVTSHSFREYRLKIYCETLLQGDQWSTDAILNLTADGVISGIEQGSPQSADTCLYGIVVPGMANAHSHSFQRLLAGLTAPQGSHRDSFWSWRLAMYRIANRISPDQFGAVAQWVFVEMLKAGYTSCAEFHYLHHQPDGKNYANPAEMSKRLIGAASVSGIAMTLLPVLYCSAGFGKKCVDPEQQRFANSADQYLRLLENCKSAISDNPLIQLGVAPHSLRAVPGHILHEVLQSWPDQRCPVHIHIAEQPAEVEDCRAFHGARPVEWLLEQFPVDRRWCLVHATFMSEYELQLAAASQATACLCPTTEADLGDGIFRTSDWLKAGGSFSIGSDSNIRISVAEELRLLEYNERLKSGQRNVLTDTNTPCGRFLYQHAAGSGAAALGQAVGRLEPGYRADLLELDNKHELLSGRECDEALDSWIFAGDRSMINSVWVAGRRVINQGYHATEKTLRSGFAKVLSELYTA
jgi:formimidoylglutamate deiminase